MNKMILLECNNVGSTCESIVRGVLIIIRGLIRSVGGCSNLSYFGSELQVAKVWQAVWVVLPICKCIDDNSAVNGDLDIITYY